MRATTTGGGSRSESDAAREKTRRDERAFFFRANEPTAKVLVSRTHRLGPELGVHLVHSGVEPAERADVLLVLPRDLFGLAPLRRRESARGEGQRGEIGRLMIFSREGRTRLKGRRARSTEISARGGRPGAREAREKSRGITTHAHVGFLLDESRTHHSRAARSAKRTTDDGSFACFAEFFRELNGKSHLNTQHS